MCLFVCVNPCLSLSRFGKKKDEKKEAKAALQRQKSDVLSDHEFERMKDERERWGALMMITICMCFKFAGIFSSVCISRTFLDVLLFLPLSGSRRGILSCGPETSKLAGHPIQNLKMMTQTPTTPEYRPSGTVIRLRCRSHHLSHLPTVPFSTPMLPTLPPKALLSSQDMQITLTTLGPSLMTTPSIGCTPKSINRGELELHLLLSLLLPTTGKAP